MIRSGAPSSVCSQFRFKAGCLKHPLLHKRRKTSGKLAKFLLLYCSNTPLFKIPTTGFEWEDKYWSSGIQYFRKCRKMEKNMLRNVNGCLYICTLYWEGIILPIIHNFLPGIIFKSQKQLMWNKVQCPADLDKDLGNISWWQIYIRIEIR